MLYLVSTKLTQGERGNDFCHVPEGELLRFGLVCDCEIGKPDGACGCARSMNGIDSSGAVTTMQVVETDKTAEELAALVAASYTKDWGDGVDWLNEVAILEVKDLGQVSLDFGVGSVLELRYDQFNVRRRGLSRDNAGP